MKRKEKHLKKSCQNPAEHARRMTQYNFRTRLEPNLLSGQRRAAWGSGRSLVNFFLSYLILTPKEHRLKRLKKHCNHASNSTRHFDKAGTVLASRYAHSSCARMTCGAKTGYTTILTTVTSPNSWTTYHACLTRF